MMITFLGIPGQSVRERTEEHHSTVHTSRMSLEGGGQRRHGRHPACMHVHANNNVTIHI